MQKGLLEIERVEVSTQHVERIVEERKDKGPIFAVSLTTRLQARVVARISTVLRSQK